MTVFAWLPTYGSVLTVQPEVHVIPADQFGSDVERRIQVGTHHIKRVWSLTFENRPNATADQIEAFLTARGGLESFDWVPPHGAGGKWVCSEWSSSPTSPATRSVSATFEEVAA